MSSCHYKRVVVVYFSNDQEFKKNLITNNEPQQNYFHTTGFSSSYAKK